MSFYLDHKYTNLISSRLDKFVRKNTNLYNFRCPICKDSTKSKIKARAYLYPKKDGLAFKCHNCFENLSFSDFLKHVDPDLLNEYIIERYLTKNVKKPKEESTKEPKYVFNFRRPGESKTGSEKKVKDNGIFSQYKTIEELPETHTSKKYLVGRQIPSEFLSSLYYVPNFQDLAHGFEPETNFIEEPRIVIPFYDNEGKLLAFQGRAIGYSKLRYITIKVEKDAPKIFGLDRVDINKPVYILEGPFDSMFLQNAIATAGANIFSADLAKLFPERVYVYDNEPRKIQICVAMKDKIEAGEKVCIWPSELKENDINNMILSGKNPGEIEDIINLNTFSGLTGRIKLSEWRKN